MAEFELRLLRLRTLVILPAMMFVWLNASVAFADPLGLPLEPVTQAVNSLVPVQLPPVELPQQPVVPGVDAEQVVGNTVTEINNTVPLPEAVPDPIDVPLPGTEIPVPPLPGGPGGGFPPQPPTDTQAGRLPDGTVVPEQRAAVGAAIILSARLDASTVAAYLRSSDLMKPAPAGTSDSAFDFSDMSTGLALVPFLGLLCAVMALLAYLRSGQHLWRARA